MHVWCCILDVYRYGARIAGVGALRPELPRWEMPSTLPWGWDMNLWFRETWWSAGGAMCCMCFEMVQPSCDCGDLRVSMFDQDGPLLDWCSSCTSILCGWAAEDCRVASWLLYMWFSNTHIQVHVGMMYLLFWILQAVDPLWIFSLDMDSRKDLLCTLDEVTL